jgi:hypothetical protein
MQLAAREAICFDRRSEPSIFIKQSQQILDCASQESTCTNPGDELTTYPAPAATQPSSANAPPANCFQCTHGPHWDFGESASTFTLPRGGDEEDWVGGKMSMSSSASPCMWADTEYSGDSEGTIGSVNAKSCVNTYDDTGHNIRSLPCRSEGLAKFYFDYGSQTMVQMCERKTHKNFYTRSYPPSYPGCVTENFEKCFVKRADAERVKLTTPISPPEDGQSNQEITHGGGANLGENRCALELRDVTKCVCKCSSFDISSEKCTKAEDAKHSAAIMTDKHSLYDLCSGFGSSCIQEQETRMCSFLGDDSTRNHARERWILEKDVCAKRSSWECSQEPFEDLCGLSQSGKCISKWVACNSDQQAHFDKKKAYFESERVPGVCLSDVDGKYPNKFAQAKLDQYGVILAAIVFLFLVSASTLAVGVAVGAGTQVLGAVDVKAPANDIAGLRSWDSAADRI